MKPDNLLIHHKLNLN